MGNKIQNARLKMYLEAEQAVLTGQSYTIGNRTLTRANLATIRNAIDDLIAAGATLDGEPLEPAGCTKRVLWQELRSVCKIGKKLQNPGFGPRQ